MSEPITTDDLLSMFNTGHQLVDNCQAIATNIARGYDAVKKCVNTRRMPYNDCMAPPPYPMTYQNNYQQPYYNQADVPYGYADNSPCGYGYGSNQYNGYYGNSYPNYNQNPKFNVWGSWDSNPTQWGNSQEQCYGHCTNNQCQGNWMTQPYQQNPYGNWYMDASSQNDGISSASYGRGGF